jgi:hypothetical protein
MPSMIIAAKKKDSMARRITVDPNQAKRDATIL